MVPFWVPNIVRHPYEKESKMDPNLENCPSQFGRKNGNKTVVGCSNYLEVHGQLKVGL